MTSIDIVIPCAGRVTDLLRLLASLHDACADSFFHHVASITATDDRHSTLLGDQVRQVHPQVNYVAGPARGPAANRNHGSTIGRAEWILFLDDDCFLRTDLVAAYLRRIVAAPDVEVFEGAIHSVGDRPNGNHHAPLNTTGGHLWSCNMLIRRRSFDALGGFDEEYPFACLEDCDLMLRLQARRAVIEFADEAVVFHPWRSISEREVTRQIISHAIHGEKHPDFVVGWSLVHLLRAMRGRFRQYGLGHFASIPGSKYRTVAFDFMAPVVVYTLMRCGPLRRVLADRYRNRPRHSVHTTSA